jgi:hypothetical protein
MSTAPRVGGLLLLHEYVRCAPVLAPVRTDTVRRGLAEFRILGPLEVVGDRGIVRLGGTRQRATLAILLLNANRVV